MAPLGGPSLGPHWPGHYQAPGLDEIALGRGLCREGFSARPLGLPHSQVPSSVRVDVKPQTLAFALRAPRCFVCTVNRSVPVEVRHENHEPLGHCRIHSGRVSLCRAHPRTPGVSLCVDLVPVQGLQGWTPSFRCGVGRPECALQTCSFCPEHAVCWCASPGSGCEILENLYVVPENSY